VKLATLSMLVSPLMSRTAQLGVAILGLLVIVFLANRRRDRDGK